MIFRRLAFRSFAALGLIFIAACQPVEHTNPPRNLLLVTMDSVRADRFESPELFSELPFALSYYIDESQVFEGISSVPATQPAIACLFTGRHASELGHPAPDRELPANIPTLAEAFSKAGYDTAAFVAPHSLSTNTGIQRGFTTFSSPSNSRSEDYEVTQAAREWLSETDRSDRPWFVWVHLNAGHGPYRALETAFNPLNFFNKSLVPYPRRLDRKLKRAKSVDANSTKENSSSGILPEYQRVGQPHLYSRYRGMYDARVRVGDWFANELRHALKYTGQYDQTAVAVIGTHGESLGEHDVEFDHGYNLFDEVIKVPFMIRVPGRIGERNLGQASHVDFAPTALALFGLPAIDSPGQNLLDRSSDEAHSHLAISELYAPIGNAQATSIRSSEWAVIDDGNGAPTTYDLEKDAGQASPLTSTNQSSLAGHHEELARYKKISPPAVDQLALKPWTSKQLQALGYVLSRFE